MDFSDIVVWLLGAVGLSFFLIPVLPERYKSFGALVLVFLVALMSSSIAVRTFLSGESEMLINGGFVFGPVLLRVDALAAWFILIVNITAVTGAWYGAGYTRKPGIPSAQQSLHWLSYVIFHASMILVCMVQHTFAFLVVWEMMSLSSLVLILYDYSSPKTVRAALNYLIQMHIGVVLLTAGFIVNYHFTGSYEFSSFYNGFSAENGHWVFLILFSAFAIKAGFLPLHTWLPHAHPAAPSHVSGVMSGVIVKMGIYGILRLIIYIQTNLVIIGQIILILSVLTTFYGILYAAVHRDYKKMLAYCTVENVGIIGIGIGIGLVGKGLGNKPMEFIGFAGAIMHTLNHSLYKSLLFFSAGNVYRATHTRNMEQLGGLIKQMPVTAFFFLCGSLAICGFPPFNGFISEFLIYSGLMEGIRLDNTQFSSMMIICITFLAITGGVSLLAFTKAFGVIFLGSPRSHISHKPEEVSRTMIYPLAFILLLMLAIGLFPGLIIAPLTMVVGVFGHAEVPVQRMNEIFQLISQVGIASLVLIILAATLFFIRRKFVQQQRVAVSPTWGCGYTAPNTRMQYSSKSYVRSLTKLFSFMLVEKKKFREISNQDIFPKYRSFQSYFLDFFEENIIQRALNYVLKLTNYFTFIHNGKIQMYILYGVFFILVLIMITFFHLF